jgi:hypothetical protein
MSKMLNALVAIDAWDQENTASAGIESADWQGLERAMKLVRSAIKSAKTAAEVRDEAARLCRELAFECARRGGDEQADALREVAADIRRIRLTKSA